SRHVLRYVSTRDGDVAQIVGAVLHCAGLTLQHRRQIGECDRQRGCGYPHAELASNVRLQLQSDGPGYSKDRQKIRMSSSAPIPRSLLGSHGVCGRPMTAFRSNAPCGIPATAQGMKTAVCGLLADGATLP